MDRILFTNKNYIGYLEFKITENNEFLIIHKSEDGCFIEEVNKQKWFEELRKTSKSEYFNCY